jgi:hypothetical protein
MKNEEIAICGLFAALLGCILLAGWLPRDASKPGGLMFDFYRLGRMLIVATPHAIHRTLDLLTNLFAIDLENASLDRISALLVPCAALAFVYYT